MQEATPLVVVAPTEARDGRAEPVSSAYDGGGYRAFARGSRSPIVLSPDEVDTTDFA
jgi:hypothetical protein